MQEQVNLKGKGEVSITLIKGGVRTPLFKTNLITTNARNICAKALIDEDYQINQIKAFNTGTQLANITNLTRRFVQNEDNAIEFVARFIESDFDGTVTELNLESAIGGIFSELTGLSVVKDGQSQLEVLWKITINNL